VGAAVYKQGISHFNMTRLFQKFNWNVV